LIFFPRAGIMEAAGCAALTGKAGPLSIQP
jgi:hypothetical protein